MLLKAIRNKQETGVIGQSLRRAKLDFVPMKSTHCNRKIVIVFSCRLQTLFLCLGCGQPIIITDLKLHFYINKYINSNPKRPILFWAAYCSNYYNYGTNEVYLNYDLPEVVYQIQSRSV